MEYSEHYVRPEFKNQVFTSLTPLDNPERRYLFDVKVSRERLCNPEAFISKSKVWKWNPTKPSA